MKGLSDGIVQIIVLTASVIITLIVVAFIFGFAGGLSNLTTAYQVNNAVIYHSNNYYYINFTVRTNLPITITSVQIVGTPLSNSTHISIPSGTTEITVRFPQNFNLVPGRYIVEVSLSNGNSITVPAEYE